jgi:hypothetical protein
VPPGEWGGGGVGERGRDRLPTVAVFVLAGLVAVFGTGVSAGERIAPALGCSYPSIVAEAQANVSAPYDSMTGMPASLIASTSNLSLTLTAGDIVFVMAGFGDPHVVPDTYKSGVFLANDSGHNTFTNASFTFWNGTADGFGDLWAMGWTMTPAISGHDIITVSGTLPRFAEIVAEAIEAQPGVEATGPWVNDTSYGSSSPLLDYNVTMNPAPACSTLALLALSESTIATNWTTLQETTIPFNYAWLTWGAFSTLTVNGGAVEAKVTASSDADFGEIVAFEGAVLTLPLPDPSGLAALVLIGAFAGVLTFFLLGGSKKRRR